MEHACIFTVDSNKRNKHFATVLVRGMYFFGNSNVLFCSGDALFRCPVFIDGMYFYALATMPFRYVDLSVWTQLSKKFQSPDWLGGVHNVHSVHFSEPG